MDTDARTAMETEVPWPATNVLGSLPVELLFRIARHLSTVEFCALRLSCRAVEQGLFLPFSHEFFSRKQFMISEFSLQALVDIARHPNLSKKLEHVSFGLEKLGHYSSDVRDWPEQVRFYEAAVADQGTIFSTGRAVEMLTEAFAHLPNLKTVSIRDWNSRTRFRDYNSGLEYWNSYGSPTIERMTGQRRAVFDFDKQAAFTTNVFNAVSAALAKAGARPQNIEVMLRGREKSVLDPGFWVPPRASEQKKYKDMLAGLRKLHLVINTSRYRDVIAHGFQRGPRLHASPPILDDDGLMLNVNCNQYIAYTAQSLEWLRINFTSNEYEGADAFMTYFTNPSNSKNSEDRIVYPKLKQLDIGRAEIAPTSLCAMLEGLPTIETLVLYHMRLVPNASILPLAGRGDLEWQKLLVKLPTILPKLQRVEIYAALEFVGVRATAVVFERGHYNFTIQVKDGENAMDECAKAASKLGYPEETPLIESPIDVDEDENGEESEVVEESETDDDGNAMD